MSRHFRKHGHKDAAVSININSMVANNQDEIVRRKLKQGVRIDDHKIHSMIFPIETRKGLIKTRKLIALCITLVLTIPILSILLLNGILSGFDKDTVGLLLFSLICALLLFVFFIINLMEI